MTRAKDQLDIVVPQRFHTHQQARGGDRHVYASRTRFIPDKIARLFEARGWPPPEARARATQAKPSAVDIGARMRGMWKQA
jgi:DNA helicase-2/ATP-dependent DNA helicase PcrA